MKRLHTHDMEISCKPRHTEREYGEAYSPDFSSSAHESPQSGEWSDDTLVLRVDASLGDNCIPMTEQVSDSKDNLVQDVPQKPILLERLAVVLAIWAISGFGVFATYQTDACPPEVKHREAMRAGLWVPLVLAASAGSAELVSTVSLRPVVSWGYLIAFTLLVVSVLRSRSRKTLCLTGFVLASLCATGIWCVFHMNAPPVG